MSHKAALPPLVSFGLSPKVHFQAALEAGGMPTPLEFPAEQSDDLKFVCHMMCEHRINLPACRNEAHGAIKELKRRLRPLTHRLRKSQADCIRKVTGECDMGLITVLCIER